MDFPRLMVFRAVAQHLNFSKAAEDLYLSQPAVSKHIRLLEAELGVSLFQRLGNHVELTDAGRIVRDYTQRISLLTEDVQRLLGELRGLQRGYLHIGTSSTPGIYILPEVLAVFQQEHPQIEITLAISNSAAVTHQLLSGEIEVGFVGSVEPGMVGIQVRPFTEDEIVLITPPRHALAQLHIFTPEMLAYETLIVREKGSGTRQIVESALERLNMKPGRVMELAGTDAVKRAVEAGLGLAFVSRRTVALEAKNNLVRISAIPDLRFQRQLYILIGKNARPSAAVLAFIALAMKRESSTLVMHTGK